MLTLADKIAVAGVIASVLAIVVAVLCVDLSLKTTLKVNTLIEIRDVLIQALDELEALLREIDDDDPLTREVMQKISNGYWQAKHQFEASYVKAQIILSSKEISTWSAAVPNVVAAYARFAESFHKHILDSRALNDFKAELHIAIANLERLISRRLLRFYQRRGADDLFQTRQRMIERIRKTNVMQ